MGKDFLLSTKTAQRLYHEAAAPEPIFDYHCHLSPREIAEDHRFSNLADMWLQGDHYKWRALRANGVAENRITGDADPWDKFAAWAETVPRLIGNPLYHWTHLELQRYFDIPDPLNPGSAPAIWKAANEKLARDDDLSVWGIFKKFKVHTVGTTDDPADDLLWHTRIQDEGKIETRVRPSFRPDRALGIERPDFGASIARLGEAGGKTITTLDDLLEALRNRIDFFDQRGCRASDHGLEYPPGAAAPSGVWPQEAAEIFARALDGEAPDKTQRDTYQAFLLCFLGSEYHDRGWVMQLHLSAIRSVNSRMLKTLGPDTGFDAVQDHRMPEKLSRLLDTMESRGKLPKTILYSLNPKDYYPLGSIMGSFQGPPLPGKMQLGAAWWFCDHRDGIEEQLRTLGNLGLLSRFVGMLTDSRSFLSYPRHEYFRRILCETLGRWTEAGEIPDDWPLLSGMVRDISFRNAERYFSPPG
jgi:glucuronate isomerase